MKTILLTGGYGFIGSNLVRLLLNSRQYHLVNIDKLTYAGNLSSLEDVAADELYKAEQVDIGDSAAIHSVFERYKPDGIIHLAAESHVDRSLDGPADFIQTNIVGTYNLLQASLEYWKKLPTNDSTRTHFRFLHVSTDEVYGSLSSTDPAFSGASSRLIMADRKGLDLYDVSLRASSPEIPRPDRTGPAGFR